QAMRIAGTSPVLGLVWLGVLVAVALWAGRRLLTTVFDNFQHLHYTLVFPLFVALREFLRVIAERLLGWSITPQRLNRGRRIGAAFGNHAEKLAQGDEQREDQRVMQVLEVIEDGGEQAPAGPES